MRVARLFLFADWPEKYQKAGFQTLPLTLRLRRRLDNSSLAETLFYKGSPGVKYKPS